jgi:hypothetical protein
MAPQSTFVSIMLELNSLRENYRLLDVFQERICHLKGETTVAFLSQARLNLPLIAKLVS